MIIKKLLVKNFKKFNNQEFQFNEDVNILVGNNNSGKSTVLEALDIVLNNQYHGQSFNKALSPALFTKSEIDKFEKSKKTIDDLPVILIEAFIDNVPKSRGTNNSLKEDAEGMWLKASFDSDYDVEYTELVREGLIKTIPTEFYKIEWIDFSGNQIKPVKKMWRSLSVDLEHINPSYGKNLYVSNILNTNLEDVELRQLELTYRETLQNFNNDKCVEKINKYLDKDNEITNKDLNISINDIQLSSMQYNLQFKLDSIPFLLIGNGEKSKVAIKLSIYNKSNNIDLIMIEEPENHLSHVELNELIHFIDQKRNGIQLFITTHSSFVLNKLSIDKICLLKNACKRLSDLSMDVVKMLKRLPGYDTLRVALSEKVILVEGPSDELVLKKIYLQKNNKLPEEDGIDIIVIRGIGFDPFIDIGREIGTKINVVTDNDGNYIDNVEKKFEKYDKYLNIKFISSEKNEEYSLEPALINANSENEIELDNYAEIILSKKTLKCFRSKSGIEEKKSFLVDWFKSEKGNGKGKLKVDSAMRLFESAQKFKWPSFLEEAFEF